MSKFFKLLFFIYYKWSNKDRRNSNPELAGSGLLMIVLLFNTLSLYNFIWKSIIVAMYGRDNLPFHHAHPFSKIALLVLGAIIWGIIYGWMIRDGKSVKINKTYFRSQWDGAKGTLLGIGYIVFSAVMYYCSLQIYRL